MTAKAVIFLLVPVIGFAETNRCFLLFCLFFAYLRKKYQQIQEHYRKHKKHFCTNV